MEQVVNNKGLDILQPKTPWEQEELHIHETSAKFIVLLSLSNIHTSALCYHFHSFSFLKSRMNLPYTLETGYTLITSPHKGMRLFRASVERLTVSKHWLASVNVMWMFPLVNESRGKGRAGFEGFIYPPLIKQLWQRPGSDKGRGQVWFSDQLLACQPITATGLKPPHCLSASRTSQHREGGGDWLTPSTEKLLLQKEPGWLHRKHSYTEWFH